MILVIFLQFVQNKIDDYGYLVIWVYWHGRSETCETVVTGFGTILDELTTPLLSILFRMNHIVDDII